MRRRFESLAPVVAVVAAALLAAVPAIAKEPPSREGGGGYLNAKGVVGLASMTQPPRAIIGSSGPPAVYVTQPTDDGTALARVDTAGDEPVRTRMIGGGYSIPTVAIDKSTSGLAADGNTLVLARPLAGIWQARTHFEILDAKSLRVQRTIALPGAFSFDAISPNGERLYLIEYTSPRDPAQYRVRAYDVGSGHLLAKPVVDPTESGEPMTGKPMTRTVSSTGRWAYTLYRGSDEGPFVHALDTMKGEAVCVDLAGLINESEIGRATLAMSPDGGRLTVAKTDGKALAVIDTATLEAASPESSDGGSGGIPWVLIAIAAALGLGAGGAVMAHRHRRAQGLAAPNA